MMTWLQPHFLWLLTLLPVIVFLHLWRRKRRKLQVSALFLWQKALEKTKIQRIATTWLLLLQLLAVALLSVVLAQPRLLRGKFAGLPARAIIIDASASMAATNGTESRLDEAKAKAQELRQGTGALLLIRAGITPEVVSQDQADFAAALARLEAFDAEARLEPALNLALDVQPEAEIYLISDHLPENLQELARFHYQPVGKALNNVGISAFEVRGEQFFAAFYNNAARPQDVQVQLSHYNPTTEAYQPLSQHELTLQRQGETTLSAAMPPAEGIYQLEILGSDALALDNHAYAGRKQARVVIAPAHPLLERAFLAIEAVEVQPAPSLETGLRLPADVTVHSASNQGLDSLEGVQGNHIVFAAPSESASSETVLTWNRQHDALRFVDLANARVGLGAERQATLKEQEDNLEARGWQVLARSSSLTPLILSHESSSHKVLYFAFAPSQSNLVRQPAWVIMLSNILSDFQQVSRVPLGSPLQTNDNQNGVAKHAGIYTTPLGEVVANLFSSRESALPLNITPLDNLASTNTTTQESSSQSLDFSLWLLLLILLLLLAEGYLYIKAKY